VVFEGNVPADPSQNSELGQLIEAAAAGATPPRVPVAWVGDAVAITGPAQVAFAPQTGSNLLVVGQDRDAAAGILTTCLIGLSAQLAAASQEGASPWAYLLAADSEESEYWPRVLNAAAGLPRVVS